MNGQPNRREFVRWTVGAGLGSLLLTPEAWGKGPGRAEHLILLTMAGGMSQTDTFDPKPGSASAGPLKAIKTSARGVSVSELLPRVAEQLEHLALIRSMATREGAHERAQYLLRTGYAPSGTVSHPDVSSWTSYSRPNPKLHLPAAICIGGRPQGPGFLGVEHAPLLIADPLRPVENLRYPEGVDAERFDRRRRLLEAVERKFRREHPGRDTAGHTNVYAKADRLIHSPQTQAFDVSQEPQRLREAYGLGRFGQGCLLARRLTEVGVRAVEVVLGGWDTHQDCFSRHRDLCAQLDAGLGTLVADLRQRDLWRKTVVVVLTEFGRTPKINADEGRDHFAVGWSVALGGGPIQGGRAIGRTADDGGKIVERPVSAGELLASVYTALGVDVQQEQYTPEGRPMHPLPPEAKPVSELFAS
ncbi:MAG: DUF1501 domain-containing protein [Planctomycetes bacterium]|nr:DUF1501 domain-containing protein [Planctomycetota bacterium]